MAEETPTAQNPEAGSAEHPEHATSEENLSAAASHMQAGASRVLSEAGLEREGPSLATATLVGVGVAIVEPELIPGMLIGAGALLAPKLLPAIGGVLRPVVKGVVKAGYSATMAVREMAAEAGEQVEDMVAEARAEHEAGAARVPAEQPAATGESPRRQRRQPRPSPAPATNL